MSDKKLKNWTDKNGDGVDNDKIVLEKINLKDNKHLMKQGDELKDLLEVIQFIITNSINNKEFRMFMIKRFLHNYVKQGRKRLK